MAATEILAACVLAFAAVFVLLTFLAVVMRLLVAVFPVRRTGVDPVLVAAISSSIATVMPGARVIRIEEN